MDKCLRTLYNLLHDYSTDRAVLLMLSKLQTRNVTFSISKTAFSIIKTESTLPSGLPLLNLNTGFQNFLQVVLIKVAPLSNSLDDPKASLSTPPLKKKQKTKKTLVPFQTNIIIA